MTSNVERNTTPDEFKKRGGITLEYLLKTLLEALSRLP